MSSLLEEVVSLNRGVKVTKKFREYMTFRKRERIPPKPPRRKVAPRPWQIEPRRKVGLKVYEGVIEQPWRRAALKKAWVTRRKRYGKSGRRG